MRKHMRNAHDPMIEIDTLIFDWDGTLLDSRASGYQAFVRTFGRLQVPFDLSLFETHYSPNWYHMYEVLGLDCSRWDEADRLWNEFYAAESPQPVTGARETLQELARRRYRLAVVTSGNRLRVSQEMDRCGLASLFETVVCMEDVVQKKPHPEPLLKAVEQLRRTPEQCAYVGDNHLDVSMARSAGVRAIAVKSGYPTPVPLQQASPDLLLERIHELLDHFRQRYPNETTHR